jgi:hypothetical protein
MDIQVGTLLECETADGGYAVMRALGPPEQGRDFRVVWVCTPEEYDRPGANLDGIPWPYSSLRVLDESASSKYVA